jgi:hypothetical protein
VESLVLKVLDEKLAICRQSPDDPIATWASPPANFLSVTLTKDELSIVCSSEKVPGRIKCERDLIAFKADGPLDLNQTGILASIAKVLAEAEISIFTISTYETVYILVKEDARRKSIEALKKAGYKIKQ